MKSWIVAEDGLIARESSPSYNDVIAWRAIWSEWKPLVDTLIEQLIREYETALRTGEAAEIEAFLAQAPPQARPELLRKLLVLELQAQQEVTLDEAEYRKRFAEYSPLVEEVFKEMLNGPNAPTQIDVASEPPVNPADETEIGAHHTLDHKKLTGAVGDSPAEPIRYFGDYVLLEEIARGGMGVVFKARQIPLNRIVAVKMILSGQLASEDDVKRFYAEAEAAANLDHPNIVPIFEVGQLEGQHYFSMGLIEGESLDRKIRLGPLEPRDAAEIVKTISHAIAHAHNQGVIHRDLKPGNILIDNSGQPKVTDFGLAKIVTSNNELTATGQVMGTPSYMPPEQAQGMTEKMGPLVDVYSLGAILYTLLTGRPPFQTANPIETMYQVVKQDPVSLRQLNASVPRDLETICLKCLEKNQSARYDSAAELADELDRYLLGKPIQARAVSSLERTWRWCRRNRMVASLSAVIAAVLVIGTIIATSFAITARQQATVAEQKAVELQLQLRRAENEQHANQLRAIQRGCQPNAQKEVNIEEAERVLANMNPDYRNSWETRYARNLLRRKARIIPGHPDKSITRWLEFNKDASRIAAGNTDLTISVWDTRNGSQTNRLAAHKGAVNDLAFSDDGKWLLSGSDDKMVLVWNLQNSSAQFSLRGHETAVTVVDFNIDGKRVVSGDQNGIIKIWDRSALSELLSIDAHAEGVSCVSFGDRGRRLVSGGSDGSMKVWDSDSGDQIHALDGHKGKINVLVFSSDGKRIFSGSNDKTIKVWDAATGQLEFTLGGHEGPVESLVVSSDGRRVISGSADKTVKVWDATSWESVPVEKPVEKLTIRGHKREVDAVSFHSGGERIISASLDKEIKTWELNTGSVVSTVAPMGDYVKCLSITRDGKKVVSGGKDETIRVWDADTSEEIHTLRGHKGLVHAVCFSDDGKRIASGGDDKTIRVWDAESGRLIRTLKGHKAQVYEVGFSSDGKQIVSASLDRTIRIWDADTGELTQDIRSNQRWAMKDTIKMSPNGRRVFHGDTMGMIRNWNTKTGKLKGSSQRHRGAVRSLDVSHDGRRIVSVGLDKRIVIWDQRWPRPDHISGLNSTITVVRLSDNGQRIIFCAHNRRRVTIFDLKTKQELYNLVWKDSSAECMDTSGDGNRVVFENSRDGTINLWEVESSGETISIKPHGPNALSKEYIDRVTISADGKRIVTGSRGGVLKGWDADSGKVLFSGPGHSEPITALNFSKDGKQFISGGRDDIIKVWESKAGKLLTTLFGHKGEINSLDQSRDGKRIVSGSSDKTVKIWDKISGKEIYTLQGHKGNVNAVSLSRDGLRLVSGSDDRTIKVWDVETGQELLTLLGHEDFVESVHFSRDGKQIVSGSPDGTIKIWDVLTGQLVLSFPHLTGVTDVLFSEDGKRIFSCGNLGSTIKIWDAETGQEKLSLPGHISVVANISLSEDGNRLASVNPAGTIKVWDAEPVE